MLRIHPSGAGERSDGMGGAENEDWSVIAYNRQEHHNQHVEGMLGSEILGRESLTSPT